MKVTVIGTGYVGLVTAACLADMGNDVVGVDVDRQKVAALLAGQIPIHEPGLDELVLRNARAGRLRFTSDTGESIRGREVIFIAVGTPPQEDGSADLRHVVSVARSIGEQIDGYAVIVNKSTVPVGTAETVAATVRHALQQRGASFEFDVASNPEFLKEGAAIADFQRPDRIIVGSDSPRAIERMRQLYAPFSRTSEKLIVMDARSAELTKYAANAMLATRISFMNEVAALADALGADIEHVRRGIGTDPRIGPLFLYPGAGFGGSCFPKDLRALAQMADAAGVQVEILPAVTRVNERQKRLMVRRLHDFFGGDLRGRTVALWGVAFKPETDDVREAPALTLIGELVRAGAQVVAYDPEAHNTARVALQNMLSLEELRDVRFAASARDATQDADVLVLMTEWKEFRSPDFAWLATTLRARAVFDGRNQFQPQVLAQHGLTYIGVGRGVRATP